MAKKKNRGGINALDRLAATSETSLRYDPQVATLKDLARQAGTTRRSDVNVAKANATAMIRGAAAARPQVRGIYRKARGSESTAAADVAAAFTKLGAAADPFRAVTAREQGGAANKITEERSRAIQELTDRQQQAAAGRASAIANAHASYNQTLNDLNSKLTEVVKESGTYLTGRLATLAAQRAANRQKTNTALGVAKIGATSRTDAAHIAAKSRADAAAKKAAADAAKAAARARKANRASSAHRESFANAYSKALRYAHDYGDPHQAMVDLVEGVPTIKTASGRTAPGVPSLPQLAVQAALDTRFHGYLRDATVRRLRKAGYRPLHDLPGVRLRSQVPPGETRAANRMTGSLKAGLLGIANAGR